MSTAEEISLYNATLPAIQWKPPCTGEINWLKIDSAATDELLRVGDTSFEAHRLTGVIIPTSLFKHQEIDCTKLSSYSVSEDAPIKHNPETPTTCRAAHGKNTSTKILCEKSACSGFITESQRSCR